jgi:hypothetical protein
MQCADAEFFLTRTDFAFRLYSRVCLSPGGTTLKQWTTHGQVSVKTYCPGQPHPQFTWSDITDAAFSSVTEYYFIFLTKLHDLSMDHLILSYRLLCWTEILNGNYSADKHTNNFRQNKNILDSHRPQTNKPTKPLTSYIQKLNIHMYLNIKL